MTEILVEFFNLFNWIDLLLISTIIILALRNKGFIEGLINLAGLIISFIVSLRSYEWFSYIIQNYLSIPDGFSKSLAFIIIWLAAEGIFFTLAELAALKLPKIPKKIDRLFGIFPSILDSLIVLALICSLVVALPLRSAPKRAILDSYLGPKLLSGANIVESKLRVVFNDAITDTLNFISISPTSSDSVNLGFQLKEDEISFDPIVEIEMFNRINRERKNNNLNVLFFDDTIRDSARKYAVEMITNGFFSHNSLVDGSTPDQRLSRDNIKFNITGENLAFAPDVEIAHTGLMNSPGHRANILSPEYNKVGVGVVDAGIFGKIFVQEFTD